MVSDTETTFPRRLYRVETSEQLRHSNALWETESAESEAQRLPGAVVCVVSVPAHFSVATAALFLCGCCFCGEAVRSVSSSAPGPLCWPHSTPAGSRWLSHRPGAWCTREACDGLRGAWRWDVSTVRGAGLLLSCLARTSAERRASVIVQPGVRVRPRGPSLQGAVPEPPEQDPLLWV